MPFLDPLRVGTRLVAFRPERPEDRGIFFQIYASTRQEELEVTGWSPEQKEQFLRMQFQAQDRSYRQNYPGSEFLMIMVDGVEAGRLYLHRAPDEIRVMDIALLPSFRRLGVGGAVLRSVTDEALRLGVPVTIHVETFNPARRLYERLGFVPAGTDPVYLLMQWRPGGAVEPGGPAN